jgi:hypothetical protein
MSVTEWHIDVSAVLCILGLAVTTFQAQCHQGLFKKPSGAIAASKEPCIVFQVRQSVTRQFVLSHCAMQHKAKKGRVKT